MNIFIVKLSSDVNINWSDAQNELLNSLSQNDSIRESDQSCCINYSLSSANGNSKNNSKKALSHPSTPCHFCAPLLGRTHTSGSQKFHFVPQGLEARNNNHNRCNLKPRKMHHTASSGNYGETCSFHSNVPVTSFLPDCSLKPSFMWISFSCQSFDRTVEIKMEEEVWGMTVEKQKIKRRWPFLLSPLSRLLKYIHLILVAK